MTTNSTPWDYYGNTPSGTFTVKHLVDIKTKFEIYNPEPWPDAGSLEFSRSAFEHFKERKDVLSTPLKIGLFQTDIIPTFYGLPYEIRDDLKGDILRVMHKDGTLIKEYRIALKRTDDD